MAKIKQGILGKATGKVGNVITGTWKGINYVKAYAIPANPKTDAQQAVRSTFKNIITIGKSILDNQIKFFWNPMAKGKSFSGWSKFVGSNQKILKGDPSYEKIILADGSLESLDNVEGVFKVNTNSVNVTWSKNTITSGDKSDSVFVRCYSEKRNFLYSQSIPISRASENVSIVIPSTKIDEIIYLYVDVLNTNGIWSKTVGLKLKAN